MRRAALRSSIPTEGGVTGFTLGRNAHGRYGGFAELVKDYWMITERRQQYDALQAQLSEERVYVPADIRTATVPRLHHEVEIRFATALDRTGLELAQVIARAIAEQSDQERTVAREPARIKIRPIVQLLDRLQNPVPCIVANRRFIVQYARDGLRGDLSQIGDFLDSDRAGPEILHWLVSPLVERLATTGVVESMRWEPGSVNRAPAGEILIYMRLLTRIPAQEAA